MGWVGGWVGVSNGRHHLIKFVFTFFSLYYPYDNAGLTLTLNYAVDLWCRVDMDVNGLRGA